MRGRDVAIVVIAIIASIFAWYQDGTISIRNSFFLQYTTNDASYYVGVKPLVLDVDGDSKPEIVFTPARDYLSIIPTWRIRRNYHDTFVHMEQSRGLQLSGNCIGLAAGHIDYRARAEGKKDATGTTPCCKARQAEPKDRRPKFIAVVTDDYHVSLLRNDLTEVWSVPIIPPLQATMVPFHASVHVMPYRIYADDIGLVVVGVKVPGPNGTEVMMHVALHGQDGSIRWRQTADPFVGLNRDTGASYSEVSKMRLTGKDMEEYTKSVDWTHFREAVVGTLPHSWSHPWDNALDLHSFFHSKSRKKAKDHEKASHDSARYKTRHFEKSTKDDFGQMGERISSARKKHHNKPPPPPNVVVSHTEEGILLIHLYTGKVISSVQPLDKHAAYHDLDDDFLIDEVKTRTGVMQKAHGKHGFEETFQCLGLVHSGLPTAAHPVYNVTICDSEGYLPAMLTLQHYLRKDEARETETRDPLSLIGSRPIGTSSTTAATPIVIQHQHFRGNGIYKVTRDAVFMINSGLVTAVSPSQKRVVWRADTEASFTADPHESGGEVAGVLHSEEEKEARNPRHFPHLIPYHFHDRSADVSSVARAHIGNDPFVIAVGDKFMAALNSQTGAIQANVALVDVPVAPSIVADFNGDGINDILVVTKNGIYGYLVANQPSGSIVTMLLTLMVLLLALLFVSQSFAAQHEREEESELGVGGVTSFPPPPVRPVRVKRATD